MTQELVSLTIIMAVAAVSPIVAQLIPGRFIPQTVLLLVTGAALGPYGLGVIEVNDAVKLLSELGMAFLFLLAGYEIDPKRLAGHQGKVGLVTWIITLGLAGLVVTLLPFFAKQGINGIATVIALTTTALGTLMPILKERNLEGTPIGDAIISYGTWANSAQSLPWPSCYPRTGWQTMLVLGAFLTICLLCAMLPTKALKTGHRLYRFLTENANTSSQTLMRLTTFLLIFLVTISALFELDAVLGAFAAGFILRYIIPDGSKSLEMKLEGVGYGFLIPVFSWCQERDQRARRGRPTRAARRVHRNAHADSRGARICCAIARQTQESAVIASSRHRSAVLHDRAADHRRRHVTGGEGRHHARRHRVNTGRSRRDYGVPDAAAWLDHISGGRRTSGHRGSGDCTHTIRLADDRARTCAGARAAAPSGPAQAYGGNIGRTGEDGNDGTWRCGT
ncbi:MAG: cation:proton antiporter [Bifidobacterium pseudocatenulatum]